MNADATDRLRTLLGDVGPALTKTDHAHLVLREAILSGVVKPGDALKAGTLAESLGMSRIPIREALRRLEQEGLVLIRPHAGATVRGLPKSEIEENLVIRGELEALATRLAAPRISAEQLVDLERMFDEMETCAAEGDADRFGRLNRVFHLTLYQSCPYPRLNELIEQFWSLSSRSRSIFGLEPSLMRHSQLGHRQLLDALKARNAHVAEMIVRSQKNHSLLVFEGLMPAAANAPDSTLTAEATLARD